ncbi:calcitonin isoform X1 [Microcebus murinus]|uniref:calcitonin isoform X1 n=1 Tax=Microcebus murinus TaxID=30608 RepID=UPI003F6A6918
MGFQKFSLFLALSILVLYQVGSLHAAPFRSTLESIPGQAMLSEEQVRLLLAALVQDYVQMKDGELQQELETEGSSLDSARSKRCGSLSTCMLGTYTQDLNKFHTFPQTATGARAPGKKRDTAIDLERDHRPHHHYPEESLRHCHLRDSSPGRLAEQIRGCGEQQLHAHQCGF